MPISWRRLRAIEGQEWRDLLRAQLALLRATWRVRRVPIGALAIRAPEPTSAAAGDPRRAEALARAVERAAAHGPLHAECLVRSVALRDLLSRDGIAGASIRIGVRREAGRLQAHAWVRWNGRVLGDRPEHVRRFTEVDDLGVLDRS